MKTKAHMLMYPHSDGMIPPTTRVSSLLNNLNFLRFQNRQFQLTPGSPGKKRGRVTTEENEETVHVEPTTKRQR